LLHADSKSIAQSIDDVKGQMAGIRLAPEFSIGEHPFLGDVLQIHKNLNDFGIPGKLFTEKKEKDKSNILGVILEDKMIILYLKVSNDVFEIRFGFKLDLK
jgi:hypothetical protein